MFIAEKTIEGQPPSIVSFKDGFVRNLISAMLRLSSY